MLLLLFHLSLSAHFVLTKNWLFRFLVQCLVNTPPQLLDTFFVNNACNSHCKNVDVIKIYISLNFVLFIFIFFTAELKKSNSFLIISCWFQNTCFDAIHRLKRILKIKINFWPGSNFQKAIFFLVKNGHRPQSSLQLILGRTFYILEGCSKEFENVKIAGWPYFQTYSKILF